MRTLIAVVLGTAVLIGGGRSAELTVDGVKREAVIVMPKAQSESGKAPVVFAFHGHGGSGKSMAKNQFEKHWPEAIVIYPHGLPTATQRDPKGERSGWQPTAGSNDDRDLKFFDAMLKHLREKEKIDDGRIYVTGHSNGGGFSYLLWAQRGKELAAIAPCAAGSGAFRKATDVPKIPIMHIAGEKDDVVPFAGQQKTMEAVRSYLGCDTTGKPWAKSGPLVGTEYPSKVDAPMVTVIHPGTHRYPDEAPELIIKFFKQHSKKPALR